MKRKIEDIYVFIAKGDVNAVVNTCRSVNNEQLNDILLEIVDYGTTEMLDLISDAGIRCNAIYKNYTLLEYAVVCNRPDMVKWCLKHRLTRAHREKQLKMSCQALHNAPPNRT